MNKKKNITTNAVVSAFCLFISGGAFASTTDEINHLLNFVSSSSCNFERNGSTHPAAKAVEHIKKKYDYYEDDIVSAEDFIKYSATKSTMSGKQYQIHCEGKKTITSKAWLLTELERFRLNQ